MRHSVYTFLHKHENTVISGGTGIENGFDVSVFDCYASAYLYRVIYHNKVKHFVKMMMSKADGMYIKELAKIERQHVLILDDFGIQPFDEPNRQALMEAIEVRHGKKSTIVTSHIPVSEWYDALKGNPVADAVMDRLIHHAHRSELKSESLGKNVKVRE